MGRPHWYLRLRWSARGSASESFSNLEINRDVRVVDTVSLQELQPHLHFQIP